MSRWAGTACASTFACPVGRVALCLRVQMFSVVPCHDGLSCVDLEKGVIVVVEKRAYLHANGRPEHQPQCHTIWPLRCEWVEHLLSRRHCHRPNSRTGEKGDRALRRPVY